MMVRTLLPPGFRFHPTDVELVMYYLKRKVMGKKLVLEAITELNIYKFSPWDLPDKSCLKSKDLEWFFFCPREKKYASGLRMNRATEMGYWKTTGKERLVKYNGIGVGMVRTLIFHQGRAPHGKRTDWVIHEYRIEDKSLADEGVAQDAYVLCKVFHKNGLGPKNGAQYGAFHEEDWDDDSETPVDSLSPDGLSSMVLKLQKNQNSSPSLSIVDLGPSSGLPVSEPGPSVVRPSMEKVLLEDQNGSVVTKIVDLANISGWSLREAGISSTSHSAHDMILDAQNDDVVHLLASFLDDEPVLISADANDEVAHLDQGREIQIAPNFDMSDTFSGLEDLNNLADPSRGGLSFSDMEFVELNDLNAPLSFSAESREIGGIQSGGSYRPCNFSRSEHCLTGSLCTCHDINSDLSLFQHCANYPGYPCLTDSIHLPYVLDLSDVQRNSATGMPAENVYYCMNPPNNLNLASFNQEETSNAAGKQEIASDEVAKTSYLASVGAAGVQQRKIFSGPQLLLESIPADSASAAFDDSSILAKAEVTYRLSTCTKDALSVMLEESTFVHSYLLNLHGIEFQKTLADCSKGSFPLASTFICALIIWLVIDLCCCLWNCFRYSRTICCLFEPLFNLLLIIQFSLKSNAFLWILLMVLVCLAFGVCSSSSICVNITVPLSDI